MGKDQFRFDLIWGVRKYNEYLRPVSVTTHLKAQSIREVANIRVKVYRNGKLLETFRGKEWLDTNQSYVYSHQMAMASQKKGWRE